MTICILNRIFCRVIIFALKFCVAISIKKKIQRNEIVFDTILKVINPKSQKIMKPLKLLI